MKFLIFSLILFLTASVYGEWVVSAWRECSAVCDGVQVRKVFCKNPATGEIAPDSFCDATPKPATSQPCGAPCTYSWVAGEWGECSEICGPGFQSRSVQCTKVETSEAVSESYCDSPSMPALTQPCDLGVCIDEDIVDEDIVDENLNDEDLIDGEAGEDLADVDEIFIDEDTADNETVTDESETTDNVQTIDEAQTVDNETDTDSDTAVNDDNVNDETADSALSDEDSGEVDNENSEEDDDSGCGCNVIGL